MTDSYNLFRRADDQTIFCAVPKDRPVPDFVRAPGWTFHGSAGADDTATPGFDIAAAQGIIELAGYYSFVSGAWRSALPEALARLTDTPSLADAA